MRQYSNFDRVMDARDHFKNGASLKSLTSRGNFRNKKYQFILILIIFCNVGFTKAQNKGDHLEPLKSIYDYLDSSIEYHMKVRKILLSGLSDSPEIRFLEIPSFTPENVLDIEYDRKQNKYYIIYHICEESIWYNRSKEQINVNKFKAEIDKASFVLIKKLFDMAIAGVKFSPTPTPKIQEDGTEMLDVIGTFDGTNFYITTSAIQGEKK